MEIPARLLDPTTLWDQILAAVADKPSLTWVRSFDFSAAALTPLPGRLEIRVKSGHREMVGFLTDGRKAQLAALVESLTGARLRIELVQAEASVAPKSIPAPGGDRVGADERREALNLPLVRQVMDLFETQLIDVRREYNDQQPQSPTPSGGDGEEHV